MRACEFLFFGFVLLLIPDLAYSFDEFWTSAGISYTRRAIATQPDASTFLVLYDDVYNGNRVYYFVKYDGAGKYINENIYGCPDPDTHSYAYDFKKIKDGNFVAAGSRSKYCEAQQDYAGFIMKVRSDFSVIWAEDINQWYYTVYQVRELASFQFITAGYYLNDYGYVFLLEGDGTSSDYYNWSNDLYQPNYFYDCIQLVTTNNFAAVGYSETGTYYADQCIVYIYDQYLAAVKYQYFGSDAKEQCFSIVQTNDGSLVVAGQSNIAGNNGLTDGYLIKMNTNLVIEWQRYYGGAAEDSFRVINKFTNGELVVTGLSGSGQTCEKFWIVSVNPTSGDVLFQFVVWAQEHTYYMWSTTLVGQRSVAMGGSLEGTTAEGSYRYGYFIVRFVGCLPGEYQPGLPETCLPCAKGYYQDEYRSYECKPCSAGKYQDELGKTSCKTCGPGTYSGSAAPSCTQCEVGKYQPDSGKDSCLMCPAGKVQPELGKTICNDCPIGTYQPEQGKILCINCAAGWYNAALGQTICKQCDVGKYQDQEGKDNCKACPSGTFNNALGKSICTNCPAGKFQLNTGQTSCEDCAVGWSQPEEGKTGCVQCGVGTYQNEPGKSACNNCLVGTYQDQMGQTGCKNCELGKYQDQPGKSSCTSCAAGTYQDAEGKSICKSCLPGSYQDETGKTTCKPCVEGQYQNLEAQSKCLACPLGTANNAQGKATCPNCLAGTYQDQTGQTSCKLCLEGAVQSEEGKSSCIGCLIGTYQNEQGKATCKPCPIGQYQDQANQSSCKLCPAGQFQSQEGKTICELCPTGMYQNEEGKNICKPCLAGTYQDETGKIICKECKAGEHQNLEGKSSCIPCELGTYQVLTGKTLCDNCPIGKYQDETGKTICKSCLAGEYQDQEGKSSCKKCTINTYQPLTGSSSCKACETNTFSAEGSISCIGCDIGWFPKPDNSGCLYKGLFESLDAFNNDPIRTSCYDGNINIIKPFTKACRDAYHAKCCAGGSKLSGVSCNAVLELLPENSLYNNYCSACPFMDYAACPANTLCWDNTAWTDNSKSPYPAEFSSQCLSAVDPYCSAKLQSNPNDIECTMFSAACGASITGAAYGELWNKFKVTINKKFPLQIPDCNTIFENSGSYGQLTCSRISDTDIEFSVSNLLRPIMNFTLSQNTLKDSCGFNINPRTLISVIAPTLTSQSLSISGEITNICNNLIISSIFTVFFSYVLSNRNLIHGIKLYRYGKFHMQKQVEFQKIQKLV